MRSQQTVEVNTYHAYHVMNIHDKKYLIPLILTLFFIALISPVVAADTSDGQFVDRAASDDGALTIKSTENNTIFLFQHETPLWSYHIPEKIWTAAISPEGNYIAIGSEGGLIWLFNQNGALVWNKSFGNGAIRSIEFSQDSQYLDASNFMNQAFFLSLDGNPATRPSARTATEIPTGTAAITQGQNPANPDVSWIVSFLSNNLNLLIGVVALLCITGITWYAISQRGRGKKARSVSVPDFVTLKNFAFFSLVLLLLSFLPDYYPLGEYTGFFRVMFEWGIFCFILAFFLYALKVWGTANRIGAVLMVAIPIFAYTMATSEIPQSTSNIFVYLGIQFCLLALFSAIVLFVSDAVKTGLDGIIRAKHSSRYFRPDATYAFCGLVIVSIIAVNAGSVATFWDNSHTLFGPSVTKSIEPVPTTTYDGTTVPRSSLTAVVTTYPSTPVPTTIKNFLQSPKSTTYSYMDQGSRGSITFTTYSGLADHFSEESHSYYHDFEKETIGELLENDYQNENLQPFIQRIRQQSNNPDDQAKIAISLVQHIPYNWNALYSGSNDWYYPYETLYNNKGVCADKSLLLAYLLNELGYDTVIFEFPQHMAVGIKTQPDYDFYGSGYAFIESTRPVIPTYLPDTYYGGFTISPNPNIIHLNGGTRSIDFNAEKRDAVRFKQLQSMGQVLDQVNYNEWQRISSYYDLQYDT